MGASWWRVNMAPTYAGQAARSVMCVTSRRIGNSGDSNHIRHAPRNLVLAQPAEGPVKRLCCLVLLTLLSSSAFADSISFSVGGHRLRIEAPRNCRSTSCASASVSGLFESRQRRDRFDVDDGELAPLCALQPSPA